MTAGYSGTPLPKKLGIREKSRLALQDAPRGFDRLLDPLPDAVRVRTDLKELFDVAVVFTKNQAALEKVFAKACARLVPDGSLWIAWPKKSSKLAEDLDENIVRAQALAVGLVDNKVCAIDETWSGLRLVVRKENRATWKASGK